MNSHVCCGTCPILRKNICGQKGNEACVGMARIIATRVQNLSTTSLVAHIDAIYMEKLRVDKRKIDISQIARIQFWKCPNCETSKIPLQEVERHREKCSKIKYYRCYTVVPKDQVLLHRETYAFRNCPMLLRNTKNPY